MREQETTGDFPGGLKDLDTDNPDVKEALIKSFQYWIEVADFDGFRIDTVKHIDRPEVDRNVRGFWGDFTDAHARRRRRTLGKQNFFIFGEGFDGNDALIGSYTFGGNDAQGTFGRFDSMFYFSQKYEGIDAVFAQRTRADEEPRVPLQLAHRPQPDRSRGASANGYPAGPDFGTDAARDVRPTAASASRRTSCS